MLVHTFGKVNATVYKNITEQHAFPSSKGSVILEPIFTQDLIHCHAAKTANNPFKLKMSRHGPLKVQISI